MLVSIIVPAFNEEKLLGATLQAIRDAAAVFHRRGWSTELIVCDNNSTDRTAEIAREAGARVVFEPVNQIARARNAGAAVATGVWLIFIDADSRPGPDLFDAVAEEMKREDCVAGGCVIQLDASRFATALLVRGWNLLSRWRRWAAGSFIFCRAAIFREAGGFSHDLFAGEEIDLFQRLKRLARRERKQITIIHRHALTTSARKLHLYSKREHLRFLFRTVLGFGRTLKSREQCHTWYDGRR